ncbi:MAG: DUF2071 domain-containing protein [Phycisphaerae bacterium]
MKPCIVLEYATRAEDVRPLLPAGVEPVCIEGFALWNIIAARIEKLRPVGVPRPLGVRYHHVAYRLRVQVPRADGEPEKGLLYIRNDGDRRRVHVAGSRFLHLRSNPAQIRLGVHEESCHLQVLRTPNHHGNCTVLAEFGQDASKVPDLLKAVEANPGLAMHEPVRFVTDDAGRILRRTVVDRDAENAVRQPLTVQTSRWAFFEHLSVKPPTFLRGKLVSNADYTWRIGQKVGNAVAR